MPRIFDNLLVPFCCNRNHYFTVRIDGLPRRFCTRSTPMVFGAFSILAFSTTPVFHETTGSIIAILGLCLVLPDIIYWLITRLNLVRDYNEIRIVNGFLLGIGIVIFGQASISIVIKILISITLFLLLIIADGKLKPKNKVDILSPSDAQSSLFEKKR